MQKPSTILSQFKQYPSLELNSNTKFIKTIHQASFDKPDILWVATEKIHGSNFSIVYDFSCNRVKYARRNDFLTDEIPVPVNDVQPFFKQNFFDIHETVQGFHNDLQKIKINVLKKYQNIQGIQIYGQYFGGFWPQGNCKRRIQPGVYYTAQHQYMVFDIRLIGEEFHTWAQVTQIPAIVEDVLKYVPIHAKGTFQQLQKVNTEFDSTIPTLLGLKHIKNNICEGLVIRPNKNLFSRNRIILKKKNKEFLEKVGLKKDPKAQKVDKEGMKEHKEVLQAFINENRIQSAISKHPDFQDQYHLKGHVVQDVLSDAQKQGYKLPEDPKLLKEVKKFLDVMAFVKVTDYLKKQRPQFADRIKG